MYRRSKLVIATCDDRCMYLTVEWPDSKRTIKRVVYPQPNPPKQRSKP